MYLDEKKCFIDLGYYMYHGFQYTEGSSVFALILNELSQCIFHASRASVIFRKLPFKIDFLNYLQVESLDDVGASTPARKCPSLPYHAGLVLNIPLSCSTTPYSPTFVFYNRESCMPVTFMLH